MVSKKYFTALFVRTALKTNTKCFHPTEIPIFRKSISGSLHPTCTNQGKQETRHKAYNGSTTPFPLLFDSASLYVFVLFACCVLRGIPRPSRRRVCSVYLALSSSAAFVKLTGDCLKSQNLSSTPRADCVEGWARTLAHTNRWACFLILSLSVCLFATADCSTA